MSSTLGPDALEEPQSTALYHRFANLADAGRLAEAEALASSALRDRPSEWEFWKTQLGYICFLNEEDDGA